MIAFSMEYPLLRTAIILFYDKSGKIMIQDRRDIKKSLRIPRLKSRGLFGTHQELPFLNAIKNATFSILEVWMLKILLHTEVWSFLSSILTISKWGEEYSLFGGKCENGELPEAALRREMMEELELNVIDYTPFRSYNITNDEKKLRVERNVYIASMPDLSKIKCHEGKLKLTTFEDALKLKLIKGQDELLREISAHLKSQRLIE